MRRLLFYILPLLFVVAAGLTIFGVLQIRSEQEKMLKELQRKARAVAEGVEMSASHAIQTKDPSAAKALVEAFQNRERFQGCAIYDESLNPIAITERLLNWRQSDTNWLRSVMTTRHGESEAERFGDLRAYSYAVPILGNDGQAIGIVEVVYETSYMNAALAESWKRLSITLIALLVCIAAIAGITQRQIFSMPVRRLTRWFSLFQRGETDILRPFAEAGEFGKLVSEVEQVALSLRVARKAAADDATARIEKDEVWTEAKLRDLVRAKLGEKAFFVVSNREPYMHLMDESSGKVKCIRPAGGVVTAIDPILRACGGTWIAHGSANQDKNFVNSKDKLGVPPDDDRYILKRVWLTKEEEEGYYYGFSNEGMWPLCHVTHTRPVFRESDWQMYKAANQKFADSALQELPANSPVIFVHDYHFTLLPRMIKEKRPDVTIVHFWHIPWPAPEVFAICPYQQQILDGLLACDLLGFHVQQHCNNFLDTVNRLTECRVDAEKFSVIRQNQETHVRPFPISVAEGSPMANQRDSPEARKIITDLNLQSALVCVGVDRIDYTKGIIERIMAVDRFLEKFIEFRRKFVLVQLAAPSRTHIPRYHQLISEIDELVEKTNWKYSEGDWKPIIHLKRHFSHKEIAPYYAIADLCIVSSLHDGMNLVAKEYVASKVDDSGMLVLSKFTGAARELSDAVLVNPYATEEFADAIKFAIEMPKHERKKRMANMRRIVSTNNVYRWAGNIISELIALKK
jgi:alpha,alpha-trehalose-phosphate synthase [UDP-forming]